MLLVVLSLRPVHNPLMVAIEQLSKLAKGHFSGVIDAKFAHTRIYSSSSLGAGKINFHHCPFETQENRVPKQRTPHSRSSDTQTPLHHAHTQVTVRLGVF